jgi:hypothetical protein
MILPASYPFMNSGQLFGGRRARIVDLRNLQSDIFRQATQNQSVVQKGRAFSGAQVTNDLEQKERLSQEAVAENSKTISIRDANADLADLSPFDANYIQNLLTQVNAEEFLARSVLKLNQGQQVVQEGFASGVDFEGNPSTVTNNLVQDAGVEKQSATSTVTTNIDARRDPETEASARFRETEATITDSLVEAATFAVQEQGTPEDPSVQRGRADGGVVTNNLNQVTSGAQENNVVMKKDIDLSVDGDEILTPRSSNTHIVIDGDTVANYGSVTQTQTLVQIAEAGVDEYGNPTENGGTVVNNAVLSASFEEVSNAVSETNVVA